MTERRYLIPAVLFGIFSSGVITACTKPDISKPSAVKAIAIMDTSGNMIGALSLSGLGPEGVKLSVAVDGVGLSTGTHAMHFHEIGQCEAPSFKSAGGHYNPAKVAHGTKTAEGSPSDGPHAGDMMNIEIISAHSAPITVINSRVSLYGEHGLPALLDADGTALIVHAGADDYQSQPSGAAGPRMACAAIKK